MSGFSVVPAPLAQLPWRIILLVLAIGSFGLLVMYSAAGGSLRPWALPQGIRFFAFLAGAIALSRVRESFWSAAAFPAYAGLVVLLILVEAIGSIRGGGQRWLDLGLIRLQPSELMKLSILLALARFYEVLPPNEIRRFGAIWPAAVLVGIPAALVMHQPDLGTALMICAGGAAVMFLAGVPIRLFAGGALALAAAVPLAVNYVLHGYQRNRIMTFLNPDLDPQGTGYHISQSKIAIGSGGIFGKGFMKGTQSHLDYLPEGQTDFAFATMAEEWGLLGGCLLILAYFAIILWGINVALRAQSRFARLAAGGIASTLFFYVSINLAMVMGLAPVVGVPLPLISFGGSSQMTMLLCLGILMSIDRQNSEVVRF
ncbi:MAG: rod shape-determining protein RodA [Sphingomonas sp.]